MASHYNSPGARVTTSTWLGTPPKATPLHLAALSGHVHIARFLLERGANANITDGRYQTPLHCAVARDSKATANETAMVELLLDFRANVNAVDATLKTPCMVAASARRFGPLRVLTVRGADLQMKDIQGCTALNHAAGRDFVSAARLLITHGMKNDLGCEDLSGDFFIADVITRKLARAIVHPQSCT